MKPSERLHHFSEQISRVNDCHGIICMTCFISNHPIKGFIFVAVAMQNKILTDIVGDLWHWKSFIFIHMHYIFFFTPCICFKHLTQHISEKHLLCKLLSHSGCYEHITHHQNVFMACMLKTLNIFMWHRRCIVYLFSCTVLSYFLPFFIYWKW